MTTPLSTLAPAALLVLACVGCKDDASTDDSGDPQANSHAKVEIVAPTDGASFTEGDEVTLEVSVTDEETGEPVEHGEVTWSAPEGWTFAGDTGTVTDLPVGSYELEVTVGIGSRQVTDSVAITVIEQHDPIGYNGNLVSTLYLYSNEYDVEDEGPCNGTFDLATDASWVVTGSGHCHVDLFWDTVSWDVDFEIDGQRTGEAVEGTLFFFDEHGTRYETPYTGTITDGEVHTTFGAEFENEDGILRFSGTLDGTAQ
jgi:hypothetical protein